VLRQYSNGRLDTAMYIDIFELKIRHAIQRCSASHSTAIHSISTSVFSGNVLTATHLQPSHQLSIPGPHYKDEGYIRPTRLHIPPILHINRIHLRKVTHIRQEHINLDHLVDSGTRGLEHMREVLDALVLIHISHLAYHLSHTKSRRAGRGSTV
jgi:hypothetical protein